MKSAKKDMRETKSQDKEHKTSKRAIWALVLAVAAFFVWAMYAFPGHAYPPGPSQIEIWARNLSGLPALVALILGIGGVFEIGRSGGILRGFVPAVIGTVLAVIFLGIWLEEQILNDHPSYRRQRLTCGGNLSSFAKAMNIYINDHGGRYPRTDKWCDLLVEGDYAVANQFICPKLILYWPLAGGEMLVRPRARKGLSYFAMNPDCEVNSPGDVVLLFESKAGWNQYGGPELLAPENHGDKGCNILFNDGHVDFVGTEELGELKWK
jgi:prepilin-type processing-associated H-X9-DG protein